MRLIFFHVAAAAVAGLLFIAATLASWVLGAGKRHCFDRLELGTPGFMCSAEIEIALASFMFIPIYLTFGVPLTHLARQGSRILRRTRTLLLCGGALGTILTTLSAHWVQGSDFIAALRFVSLSALAIAVAMLTASQVAEQQTRQANTSEGGPRRPV